MSGTYDEMQARIKNNQNLSQDQRDALSKEYAGAANGEKNPFALMDTNKIYDRRLSDIGDQGQQRRDTISQQYQLLQGDVNSALQKTMINSYLGAVGAQKASGGGL